MINRATKKQIEFYEQKLYPIQDIVLNDFNITNFYLTGGTALSRFYFNHRYSDDLDFFCDGIKYTENDFNVFVNKLLNSLEKKVDKLEMTINGKFFKRLFITKNDINLKIEFIYESLKTVGEKQLKKNFYLDTKENICANKITAITDRKTIKDYFDLYYLLQDIKFEDAIKWSEYKMVPLDYENAIIAFNNTINNIEGEIWTTKDLKQEKFNNFIKNLVEKMLNYAKTK
jgi:predicted nucleotidyltransferase component of viral defense system